jgi:F0F1-type ATP synthase membrane subunit b/b'
MENTKIEINCKGENNMAENRIRKINKDIEAYREAIENAEGALAEAERELDEILECEAAEACDDSIEDYPEYDD